MLISLLKRDMATNQSDISKERRREVVQVGHGMLVC